jgi:hypothetical protein
MYLLGKMIDDFHKFMQIASFHLEALCRLSSGYQA